jgi:hypothetical protein
VLFRLRTQDSRLGTLLPVERIGGQVVVDAPVDEVLALRTINVRELSSFLAEGVEGLEFGQA